MIQEVTRSTNGYRVYSEQEVAWIEFLIRLRETGMSMQQMKRFSDLRYQGEETISARRELLEKFEQEVEVKIAVLNHNLGVVRSKIDIYKEWENDGRNKK